MYIKITYGRTGNQMVLFGLGSLKLDGSTSVFLCPRASSSESHGGALPEQGSTVWPWRLLLVCGTGVCADLSPGVHTPAHFARGLVDKHSLLSCPSVFHLPPESHSSSLLRGTLHGICCFHHCPHVLRSVPSVRGCQPQGGPVCTLPGLLP